MCWLLAISTFSTVLFRFSDDGSGESEKLKQFLLFDVYHFSSFIQTFDDTSSSTLAWLLRTVGLSLFISCANNSTLSTASTRWADGEYQCQPILYGVTIKHSEWHQKYERSGDVLCLHNTIKVFSFIWFHIFHFSCCFIGLLCRYKKRYT